jgi:hypothetical protein
VGSRRRWSEIRSSLRGTLCARCLFFRLVGWLRGITFGESFRISFGCVAFSSLQGECHWVVVLVWLACVPAATHRISALVPVHVIFC